MYGIEIDDPYNFLNCSVEGYQTLSSGPALKSPVTDFLTEDL